MAAPQNYDQRVINSSANFELSTSPAQAGSGHVEYHQLPRIKMFLSYIRKLPICPTPYGPHRQTHYTNWWAPRNFDSSSLYGNLYRAIFPEYVTTEARDAFAQWQSDLNNPEIGIGLRSSPTPEDPPDDISLHDDGDVLYLDSSHTHLWYQLRNGPRVVLRELPPRPVNNPHIVANDRLRELRTHTIRHLRVKYGVMKKNTHNDRVYRNAALQILDELQATLYEKDIVIPQAVACVYAGTDNDLLSLHVQNVDSYFNRVSRLSTGARWWRGPFLRSRPPPGGLEC